MNDIEWEQCSIIFAPDPCQLASGVHDKDTDEIDTIKTNEPSPLHLELYQSDRHMEDLEVGFGMPQKSAMPQYVHLSCCQQFLSS
jgi:hypothetical protein